MSPVICVCSGTIQLGCCPFFIFIRLIVNTTLFLAHRHVAARKGSPRLLRLLMSFAGPGFVSLRDNNGETAVDVARSHRHTEALNELGSPYAK